MQRLIDSFKISNGSIYLPSDNHCIRQAELERPSYGKNTDQDPIQYFLILFNVPVLKPGHATHNFHVVREAECPMCSSYCAQSAMLMKDFDK
ncbi:hypothetical protein DI041_04130 [Stenotrophomonas maltophilia]|nr:hypothetical protein DI034_02000 [Stenotrophomonas maltophilia]TIE64510.1 hypothetical protein DI041_04130 [Stenotrophomonas maltophilia]